MRRGQIVVGITTNSVFDVEQGREYVVLRGYWRNGEGWVRTQCGRDIPDVLVEVAR